MILRHIQVIEESGIREVRRAEQAVKWMYNELESLLIEEFFNDKFMHSQFHEIERSLVEGKLAPVPAAQKLLNIFYNLIIME